MSKQRRIYGYRPLLYGLLLGMLVGVAPAFGQFRVQTQEGSSTTFEEQSQRVVQEPGVDRSWWLGFLIGTCLHADRSRTSCPLLTVTLQWYDIFNYMGTDNRSRYSGFGASRSVVPSLAPPASSGGFGAELSATFEANNTWPDPDDDPDDPPRHLAKHSNALDSLSEGPKADHNGTYIFLGDVFFPILIEPHAMLQPFIGVGGAMVTEGDADAEANVFAIEKRGAFVFTYGIGISFKLSHSIIVGAKFRDTLFLTKKLTYLDDQGQAFEQRIGTVSTSSIQVGLSFRLTGRNQ